MAHHDGDVPVVAAVLSDRVMVWQVRIIILAFAAVSVLVIADLLNIVPAVQPAPREFGLAWIIVAVWVSYWWGFRLALRVELAPNGVLVWRCALRQGEVPIEEIVAVRSNALLMSNVIRHRRGRVLVFGTAVGFPELVAELKRRNPAIEGGPAGWMLRLDRAQRRMLRIWPWRWSGRRDTSKR